MGTAMNRKSIFCAAGAVLLLGAAGCERHSWESTQKLHQGHGADHHGDDHGHHGDEKAADDHHHEDKPKADAHAPAEAKPAAPAPAAEATPKVESETREVGVK